MKPGDRQQLDEIASLVREVLGGDAIGAYLHGSTAADRLRPTSDLDVLVVAHRLPATRQRRRLVEGLLGLSGGWPPNPRRPIELTVVVASDVRPWHYPPRCAFQYGEWLRNDYLAGVVPAPHPEPDLAPVLAMALAGGRALFGPPPSAVLDPVPADDLRRAIVAGIPDLGANLETDTRNVLLTFARIWFTLATGEVGSKDEAGAWALERLPAGPRSLLERAVAMYLGREPEAGWADVMPQVHALVDEMQRQVDALERRSGAG